MTRGQYKPLATFTYSRRIKKLRPGRVRWLRFQGKRVKVYLERDGRELKVLEAPKQVVPELKKAETVRVVDGTLRAVKPKEKPKEKPIPQPSPKPPQPQPKPKPSPPKPQMEKPPKPRKVTVHPKALTESERRKAMLVPVPDKGPIPTPYIDWNNIPEHCKVTGITYMDYPMPGAPKGMLHELREMFKRSRRYQNYAPVNVIITGPPGTGKSELIKKFAEEAQLPYWSVIGQEGIRADELLGHYELKEGTSRWVDGIIPKAVRSGGILHIDEPNVIEPAILMRLDELLDNKRQLNMEDLNGEIIKAHPDLFIVFTMNPPTYEGVKDLPDPIKSRLTKRYIMDYPPETIEMAIIKKKMKLSDAEFKLPTRSNPTPTGILASDITDVLKIIKGLRRQQDLSYIPSLRETQGFVQDILEGDSFYTAFDRNIKGLYYGEEADRVEEALNAVRRRP